jgi:hypothetical protein
VNLRGGKRGKPAALPGLIPDAAITDPSEDRLSLDAVAATLRDLVCVAETPANVAVFGAWGSGKTSLSQLLKRRLTKDAHVKYVYFNAWKYAETPLRRHFLAGAGQELGEGESYPRRLYAKNRTTTYRFTVRTIAWLIGFAILALIATLTVIAAAQVPIWLADQSKNLWLLVATASAANTSALLISTSVLAPVFTFVKNEMTVERNEDEPSSAEQFDAIFKKLVAAHRPSDGRIVFFIDELDRAPAKQMQAVLETLKTFLDQAGCLFVVAADQVVLERAISQLEDVTVPGKGNPYYSSGSAYLDKIFQFQMQLPAFEGPILTRFALDLIDNRGGIWGDLGEERGYIASLLVPAHVRSPRRVKVLLNNFVLAAQVGSHRLGGERLSPGQLRELAKLVCLRTEFPLFYRDLEAHPSLADAVTANVMDDAERIADFGISQELSDLARAYATGKAQVEIRINQERPGAEAEERAASDQLLDYLRRSRDVSISDHSLLFMRPHGAQVGLDVSIARQLEIAARNGDVAAAEAALDGAKPEVLDKAVLYITMALGGAIGVEIANLGTTLLGVGRRFRELLTDERVSAILTEVERPDVWARLRPDTIEAYLDLAATRAIDGRDRRDLAILARASEGDEWRLALISAFPHFGPAGMAGCRALLADEVSSESTIARDVTESAPDETVRRLWQDAPLERLGTALADVATQLGPEHRRLAAALSTRLEGSALWQLLAPAIRIGDTKRLVELKAAMRQLPVADTPANAAILLEAIAVEADTLNELAAYLPEKPCSVAPGILTDALASLIEFARSSDEAASAIRRSAGRLAGLLDGTEFDVSTVVASLATADWDDPWITPEAAVIRRRLHSVVVSLAKASQLHAGDWMGVIARSVVALLPPSLVSEPSRDEANLRIRNWDTDQPGTDALEALFAGLSTPRAVVAGDTLTEPWRRYWLFLVSRLLPTLTSDQKAILRSELPVSGGPGTLAAVCMTIYVSVVAPDIEDEPEAVSRAALFAGDKAAGQYAERFFVDLREPEILEVLKLLFERGEQPSSELLAWLRPNGDQMAWVREFTSRLRSASTRPDRRELWRFLAALRIDKSKAQSVAVQAALETMIDTAGSLNDLLADLPTAFPGWSPGRATVRELEKAAEKFATRSWRQKARKGLDILRGK